MGQSWTGDDLQAECGLAVVLRPPNTTRGCMRISVFASTELSPAGLEEAFGSWWG